MSDIVTLERKKIFDIPCGNVVITHHPDDPTADIVICLKIDRIGKEYMHHYLVPLDPTPDDTLQLIYADPDDIAIDCAVGVVFDLGEGENAGDSRPEIGDIFINESGVYLKIKDDPKTQKHFGYVDIDANLVRVRQERKMKTVHKKWRVSPGVPGESGKATFSDLRRAHLAQR